MPRALTKATIDDEVAAFYVYVKARLGDPRELSLREVSQLYKEYLTDREEARGAVAEGSCLSTSEAARVAGVSPQTIRNWIRAGIIPDVRAANRKGDLRIPADFMDRIDYGIKDNPDYRDPSGFVQRVRDEHEKLSEAEYFDMLDAQAASGE